MLQRNLLRLLREDDGNVESSLVLIPLLTLFLIAAQISIAIHGRNMENIAAQDAASVRAISGEFSDSDTFLHINSPDPNQNLDLLISHRGRLIPQLLPLIKGGTGLNLRTDVSGIAIVENQR